MSQNILWRPAVACYPPNPPNSEIIKATFSIDKTLAVESAHLSSLLPEEVLDT